MNCSVKRVATSKTLLLGLLVIGLSACNSTPRRDPAYSPAYPAAFPAPVQRHNGAIYQVGYERTLFEDIRARRIGDILTVRLSEATNASKSASTELDRDTETTIVNPTLLGTNPLFSVPGVLPLAATENNNLESNLRSSNGFTGESDSAQSNSLNGDITVTVADVFPNGNLYVRGEKRLNLNQGNEYIKISGIVRPIDIATDNTVPSTKIADATIIYNGDGAGADANKLGWIARFFISAVFPF
ncbi:MAG: flagellar basal body L-ring protein FlgH [Pseudomonadota bacterium]